MRYAPEPLDRDEVRRLLDEPSKRYPTGVRNRALLAVLHGGGLRCSEALDLELRDFDRSRQTVHIRRGKGGGARIAVVGAEACERVEAWLAVRPDAVRLFCTLAGDPLSTRYVRAMVARLGRRAGIAKRCHPHGLRHTHASELAEEGFELRMIADQLGHRSVATTDAYIRHIAPHRRIAALGKRVAVRAPNASAEGPH